MCKLPLIVPPDNQRWSYLRVREILPNNTETDYSELNQQN